MPSRRVAVDLNAGTYYLTLTIQRWYYLFDRYNRWQILAESLRYCQENKGLELNGYVFMMNHIHLIATSPDMAGFLRDFKRFTEVGLIDCRCRSGPWPRCMCNIDFTQLSRAWPAPTMLPYKSVKPITAYLVLRGDGGKFGALFGGIRFRYFTLRN